MLGKVTVAVVPRSAVEVNVSVPLCACTMRLTMASPSPLPDDLVEKNGLVS